MFITFIPLSTDSTESTDLIFQMQSRVQRATYPFHPFHKLICFLINWLRSYDTCKTLCSAIDTLRNKISFELYLVIVFVIVIVRNSVFFREITTSKRRSQYPTPHINPKAKCLQKSLSFLKFVAAVAYYWWRPFTHMFTTICAYVRVNSREWSPSIN